MLGTYTNTGSIANEGALTNLGDIVNSSTINNSGTFDNTGTFTNMGTLKNNGVLRFENEAGISMGSNAIVLVNSNSRLIVNNDSYLRIHGDLITILDTDKYSGLMVIQAGSSTLKFTNNRSDYPLQFGIVHATSSTATVKAIKVAPNSTSSVSVTQFAVLLVFWTTITN